MMYAIGVILCVTNSCGGMFGAEILLVKYFQFWIVIVDKCCKMNHIGNSLKTTISFYKHLTFVCLQEFLDDGTLGGCSYCGGSNNSTILSAKEVFPIKKVIKGPQNLNISI